MAETGEIAVGVDLGGTKIEAIALRMVRGEPEPLARLRVPTHQEHGYDAIVKSVAELISQVKKDAGLSGLLPIGIGMPGSETHRAVDGTRSPEPLVKNSNTTCLNGRPFQRDLCALVGARAVFANDANCFVLAEASAGAARDAEVCFGVIMGTGVGGGIVLRCNDRARIWAGPQAIAGEWGHIVLDPVGGAPCYCGRRGCVETYLSGPAIERQYKERTGRTMAVAEMVVRASKDEAARACLTDLYDRFGRAIATVLNVLDPNVVVLGGGVSNVPGLYDEGVAAAARWTFTDEFTTRIVRNTLGDSAGVMGAAFLAMGWEQPRE